MNYPYMNTQKNVYFADMFVDKEALYIGEPTRQQKNLVIAGCRVEFN